MWRGGSRKVDKRIQTSRLSIKNSLSLAWRVVPSAAHELPFLLLLGEGVVLVLGDDGQVHLRNLVSGCRVSGFGS